MSINGDSRLLRRLQGRTLGSDGFAPSLPLLNRAQTTALEEEKRKTARFAFFFIPQKGGREGK